jgi:acyl homoserine lactone synthase
MGASAIEEAPMILLVNGSERDQHRVLVNEMYRQRARVFKERLGWDVEVNDGMEIDRFDEENPLYLISVDDVTGQLRGSVRLLPTTGPNMLRNVFPELLPDGLVIESATIWEASRFAMDPDAAVPLPGRHLSYVTGELLAGLVEIGLMVGVTEIASVIDARMVRVLRLAGYPAELISPPRRIGVCITYAGLSEVNEAALERIRSACGIKGSVLQPHSIVHHAAA